MAGSQDDARIAVRSTLRNGHCPDAELGFWKMLAQQSFHVIRLEKWARKGFPADEVASRLAESGDKE